MNPQRVIDRLDETIVERPGRVVLAFLVVTVLFGTGLGNIGTTAGTSQFAEDIPAQNAFEQVNDDFSPTFETDTGSTQLIQRHQNVLSRPALLAMLESQERVKSMDGLRVTATGSAASIVAQQLDPSATTLDAQIDAVERATPSAIDAAVRRAADGDGRFVNLLSNDFNRRAASASATIGTVTHRVPAGLSSTAGQGGTSPLTGIQRRAAFGVDTVEGNVRVFGSGLISAEFSRVIIDSLLIVVPAAVLFILLFLVLAYRDLVDLLLGTAALGMTIVWTFGFMGLAGIPFSQMLIAVPPLLLAVGIDFGIHAINRYREERATGRGIGDAMMITTDQLLVAFFIVTGTTVIGFGANLTSSLGPIQDFGVVAGIGIVFTFLIFGVFLPALKVLTDHWRERYPIPTISQRPLGSEGSGLSRLLRGGVVVANRVPVAFLLLMLVLTAGAGWYATGISTSFEQEDFLPPEENPEWMMQLPEPFRPGVYTVTKATNFLEENFETSQSGGSATVFIEGPMQRDTALESIHSAGLNPPDSFVRDGRRTSAQSVLSVIQSRADRNESFAALVARHDSDGNGVPDDDLADVYDALLSSPARDDALQYMTADRRSARVVYTTKADATQPEIAADTRAMADRYRMTATATGQVVVFEAVSDVIFESAVTSLAVALLGATVFLILIYRVLEDRATLGVANVFPILVTVALVAGTMRYLGIPFNALTATILAITIGLGIDYSVHVTHRFADERRVNDLPTALDRTVRGTGGALLGSMLTTVSGIGVLALALFPAIGQFGVLTGISIVYAFLSSVFVQPSALVVWDRIVGPPDEHGTAEIGPQSATGTPNPDPSVDD